MARQIGLYSDIHGSWDNLEMIVKSFKNLGISNSVFLGDALYNTLSSLTVSDTQKALKIKDKLKQDSDLRKEVMKGYYSDKQLESVVDTLEKNTELSRKIAKSEYQRMKDYVKDMNSMILGGNWDYQDEIKEVFNHEYTNADVREMEGLKIAGFSGGGSPVNVNIPSLSLADNLHEEKPAYKEWAKILAKKQDLGAEVYVSHVPFTDGENVVKENAVEHLKEMLLKRKQAGLDTPRVLINGHRHTSGEVKYDEELDSFLVSPGAAGSSHNKNFAPSFMTAEIDEEDNLKKLFRYEIRSSLRGISDVILTKEFELDYNENKVKTKDRNETILSESSKQEFEDNLNQDPKHWLLGGKMTLDYRGLSFAEKDDLLRRNIGVMFKEIEDRQNELSDIIRTTASGISKSNKILSKKDLADSAYKGIGDKALDILGGNIEHIGDEEDKDFFRDIALQTVYGLDIGSIFVTAADKNIENIDSVTHLADALAEESSSNLNKRYQNRLFDHTAEGNIKADDYQAMAEIYMPKNFKKTKDLGYKKTFNMWVKTYKEGLLTQGDMSEFETAYEKDKNYKANKKTKKDIAEMFDIGAESLEDRIKTTDDLPDMIKDKLYSSIVDENTPVFIGKDGKEYIDLDGNKIDAGDELKEKVDYSPVSPEEYKEDKLGEAVKSGKLPVVNVDGTHCLPTEDGSLIPLNSSGLDLKEDEYNIMSGKDYMDRRLQEGIKRSMMQYDKPENLASENLSDYDKQDIDIRKGSKESPVIEMPDRSI